mmetsp:Transcript_5118/g.16100  ORF Transcript_5118/g.16100 Transcript_5118/m.16100 type:complete len:329 (+) Transcript_5118:32-1018(+)
MASRRPELTGPPELFYDAKEARKYTSSSRMINVQAEIAERCIELLNIPPGQRRLVLDIGCGSGLSGAALEAAGHAWIGCDVSRDMLRIASERVTDAGKQEQPGEEERSDDGEEEDDGSSEEEDDSSSSEPASKRRRKTCRTAELVEHDMGLGLPFRNGTFDAAVSVSALQWLCYDNSSEQSAPRRLARFFGSLYRCLKRSSRAALQFYPQDEAQAALVATAAAKAGFAGGVVVDFPNSARAKKHYLCLSMDRSYRKPTGATEDRRAGNTVDAVRGEDRGGGRKKKTKASSSKKKDRDWLLAKKEFQRRQGRDVRPDTKFSGRKRKDRF